MLSILGMFGSVTGLIGIAILVALCVHVVKTGREIYWILIILMIPGLGALIYVVIAILPDLFGSSQARNVQRAARDALDPEREYREAVAKLKDSPTVGAHMRLAIAAAGLERYAEAEQLYAKAMTGIHTEDSALMLGRAQALLELGRGQEAMDLIQRLQAQGDPGKTPAAVLALARAQEALGQTQEAEASYEWAAGRLPGLEGQARYCAFLARSGQMAKAREMFSEIDKQAEAAPKVFKKEARRWRALAAEAGPG
ncbi:MAG: hypothetical protein JWM33_3430 [Caulobacteraceae bacterium]|nr:hypothetical protein [Caulobacteraceae bacterium]